jgi:release factor glutamine methyltransferase
LVRGDWAESLASKFDVIFANPPYVKSADTLTLAPEVSGHEPASALDGGVDGLAAYQRFAPQISELLTERGRAFLEVGMGQAEAVSSICENSNLSVDGTVTDLARIYRCLVMVAVEQQSRAKQKKQL